MVMGNAKNLCVFNFAILLKSWNFDAREIYVLNSVRSNTKVPSCSDKATAVPVSKTCHLNYGNYDVRSFQGDVRYSYAHKFVMCGFQALR